MQVGIYFFKRFLVNGELPVCEQFVMIDNGPNFDQFYLFDLHISFQHFTLCMITLDKTRGNGMDCVRYYTYEL